MEKLTDCDSLEHGGSSLLGQLTGDKGGQMGEVATGEVVLSVKTWLYT